MAFVLANKLLYLGFLVRQHAEAKGNPQYGSEQLEELRKRLLLSCQDTERYIRSPHSSAEIKVFTNCFDPTKGCDRHLVKALGLIFYCHIYGLVGEPTLAETCTACLNPHADEFGGVLLLRSAILDNIFAGLIHASRAAFFHSDAILRLSPRMLFLLVGGIRTGLARLREPKPGGRSKPHWISPDATE